MISTEKCLYLIDQRLEKLSTSTNQQIPVEDKILALNNARIEVVLTKVDINNQYGIGLDGFRKRYQDLQILIKPHEELKLNTSPFINKYIADLSELKHKYFLPVQVFIIADKGKCKGRSLSVNIIPHSDLQVLQNNNNYKPSFEYQETLGTISSDFLEIYTDETFTPTSSYISYLTYPDKFDYPGYINLDGEPSNLSNCNLPDYMENEIVSIAVRELAFNTGNPYVAQAAEITNKKNN